MSLLSDDDLHWFHEGTHARVGTKLGAHLDDRGAHFAIWAPNAGMIEVIGDWNGWTGQPLSRRGPLGLWEGYLEGPRAGMRYKFHLERHGRWFDRADPYALMAEHPPETASRLWRSEYRFADDAWMAQRSARQGPSAPIAIYELHAGSWRHPASYRELAQPLADHVRRLGFTHVELLPIMEHPFYGSWGYQTLGYFAPSCRYGNPDDLRAFIDTLHRNEIGVILDWVPSHFPMDAHGLYRFDGTALYEHESHQEGYHPDWNSAIFNYGRNEVRSFLVSSAVSWLEDFHADGLRVDAVASMLYRDYSRKEGEWVPNVYGGRENLEAISFLRQLNHTVHTRVPDALMIAEESTAWGGVTHRDGLGFDYKWDMGWMHDTLRHFARDPIYRRYHLNDLSFRQIYAHSERFVLSLSHDEVVHGKGSLYGKMAGLGHFEKLAHLRLLYAYMIAQSGKKLLFMGQELGVPHEWQHEHGVPWHLREEPGHAGVERWLADLLHHYRNHGPLHDDSNFRWISCDDTENSVIAVGRGDTLIALNLTPSVRHNHRVTVPHDGVWREVLNSDAEIYGGSGVGNLGRVESTDGAVSLALGPLSAVFLQP